MYPSSLMGPSQCRSYVVPVFECPDYERAHRYAATLACPRCGAGDVRGMEPRDNTLARVFPLPVRRRASISPLLVRT